MADTAPSPASSPDSPARRAAVRWVMPALALIAAVIAVYLAVITWSHAGVVGCTPGGWVDCDHVLGSRWSKWQGWPVAVPGAVLYLVILFLTCLVAWRRSAPDWIWLLLRGLTLIAAIGGIWFMVLQIVNIKQLCPYCTATHLCGLVLAGCAWQLGPRLPTGKQLAVAACGLAVSATLVTGQLADQSPTYRTEYYGKLPVIVESEPLIGSPQAPHVIVKMFDYTCPHCRELHQQLEEVLPQYGDQIAVVMLPVPMNRACNPYVMATHPMHEKACGLARLALAVWHADHVRFPAYHHWLFEPEHPPAVEDARKYAAELVGETQLEATLNNPVIDKHLAHGVSYYGQVGTGAIPKLLFPNGNMFQGPPPSTSLLLEALEANLKLEDAPAINDE